MRRIVGSAGLLALAVVASACGGASEEATPEEAAEAPPAAVPAALAEASAALADPTGRAVGQARFGADSSGALVVEVEVGALPAGPHGIHVHTIGSCAARNDTAFAEAGGHFNPGRKQHGLENPQGPHAGDLPNLEVAADGRGTARVVLADATLASGANALLDADGAALVIHAQRDDQRTDPSGNSGARVACGVIQGD
jgi:Cu-Zn family superoxide dismutase